MKHVDILHLKLKRALNVNMQVGNWTLKAKWSPNLINSLNLINFSKSIDHKFISITSYKISRSFATDLTSVCPTLLGFAVTPHIRLSDAVLKTVNQCVRCDVSCLCGQCWLIKNDIEHLLLSAHVEWRPIMVATQLQFWVATFESAACATFSIWRLRSS